MPTLQVKNLSIGALIKASFSLQPGQIVAISGPSGSGKSRLLRAITDLEPHSGNIFLDDKPQSAYPAHKWRSQVMLVPAQSAWWGDIVGEHLLEPMPAALQAIGLPRDAANWQVNRLSAGEQQRLALIRAVSYSPRVLLLDEPTANLDASSTQLVEQWLIGLTKKQQLPILWVAHNLEQIRRVAQRHLAIVGDHLEEQEIHR
ncbi:ATP-binding cassette domain-containing protein [Microbulbifer sp. SSSA002]|uniref:ABC transporter ATP-binding protein n=1 Tax=Microbulbifer sp. SSSA002 TaxID=3243376 RepID=UPI00403A24A9